MEDHLNFFDGPMMDLVFMSLQVRVSPFGGFTRATVTHLSGLDAEKIYCFQGVNLIFRLRVEGQLS